LSEDPNFVAARKQVMTGLALVMGGVVFGGLLAVVLHLIGQRTAAMATGSAAVIPIVWGVLMQVQGARKLRGGKP
jgi:hypothetical protein